MQFNPTDLEETEERLFAIRALARKHGISVEALPGFAGDLRAKLAALDAGDADLGRLRAELASAETAYETAARNLRAARIAAFRPSFFFGSVASSMAPSQARIASKVACSAMESGPAIAVW